VLQYVCNMLHDFIILFCWKARQLARLIIKIQVVWFRYGNRDDSAFSNCNSLQFVDTCILIKYILFSNNFLPYLDSIVDSSIWTAVEWTLFGCFWTNGQICSATSRLLIHVSIGCTPGNAEEVLWCWSYLRSAIKPRIRLFYDATISSYNKRHCIVNGMLVLCAIYVLPHCSTYMF
jgi:hypothetical protein